MKKHLVLFAILLLSLFAFAANPTWTTPPKVHVAAFSVNDYSHYYQANLRKKSLQRSFFHKEMFIDSLFSRVARKYPEKDFRTTYNYRDEDASMDHYGSAQLYHSEFVFFSGHGNQQKICLYDYPIITYSGCGRDVCPNDSVGKVYGGNTRWVIYDACLVLNVNKSDRLGSPLNAENVDLDKVDKLRTVFRGVHAILGFYSLSFEDYKYSTKTGRFFQSEWLYDYFTQFFIEEGESIWDSFSMASAYVVYDYSFFGNRGLKPAIAFLRGYDEKGNFHDTSMETFEHTFNQPIEITNTLELFVKYAEYGNPSFDSGDTTPIVF